MTPRSSCARVGLEACISRARASSAPVVPPRRCAWCGARARSAQREAPRCTASRRARMRVFTLRVATCAAVSGVGALRTSVAELVFVDLASSEGDRRKAHRAQTVSGSARRSTSTLACTTSTASCSSCTRREGGCARRRGAPHQQPQLEAHAVRTATRAPRRTHAARRAAPLTRAAAHTPPVRCTHPSARARSRSDVTTPSVCSSPS